MVVPVIICVLRCTQFNSVDNHSKELDELENQEGVGDDDEEDGHVVFPELTHHITDEQVAQDPYEEHKHADDFVLLFKFFLVINLLLPLLLLLQSHICADISIAPGDIMDVGV